MPAQFGFPVQTEFVNASDPTNPQSLATKNYVDTRPSGGGLSFIKLGVGTNTGLVNFGAIVQGASTFYVEGNQTAAFLVDDYIEFHSIEGRELYIITSVTYTSGATSTITIHRGVDQAIPDQTPIYKAPKTIQDISTLTVQGDIIPTTVGNNLNFEVMRSLTIQTNDPGLMDVALSSQLWYNMTNNTLWVLESVGPSGALWHIVVSQTLVLSTDPTTSTIGQVGQFAFNTTNSALWICTVVVTGNFTWVKVSAGSSSGVLTGSCACTVDDYQGTPLGSVINYGAYSQFVTATSNGANPSTLTVTAGSTAGIFVGSNIYGQVASGVIPAGAYVTAVNRNLITTSSQITAGAYQFCITTLQSVNPIRGVFVVPNAGYTDTYSYGTGRGYIADTQYITCNPTRNLTYGNAMRFPANMPWNRTGFRFKIDIASLNFTVILLNRLTTPNSFSSWQLDFIIADPVANLNDRKDPTGQDNCVAFFNSGNDGNDFQWVEPSTISTVETQVTGGWKYVVTLSGGSAVMNENNNPINYIGSNTDYCLMLAVNSRETLNNVVLGTQQVNYTVCNWSMEQMIFLQNPSGGSGGTFPNLTSSSLTATGSGTQNLVIEVPSNKTLVIPAIAQTNKYVANIDSTGTQQFVTFPTSTAKAVARFYANAVQSISASTDTTVAFANTDVAQTINGGLTTLGLTASNTNGTFTNNTGLSKTYKVEATIGLNNQTTSATDYTAVLYISNTVDNGARYAVDSEQAYLNPGAGSTNQQTKTLNVSAIVTLANGQGFNIRIWGTAGFSINDSSWGANNGNGFVVISSW